MKSKVLSWLLYCIFNWYSLKSKILTIVGDIRFSVWPMWLLYVPTDYAVKGKDIQQLLKQLQPGDIILRGYNKRWLDGLFIPTAYGCSHAGLYVGDDTVIHAVAQGVSTIHLIDFCQADKVAVFRPSEDNKVLTLLAVTRARGFLGKEYDFSFKAGDQTLYCFQLAAQCYKELALKKYPLSLMCFKLPKKFGTCYLDSSFFEAQNLQKVIEVGE